MKIYTIGVPEQLRVLREVAEPYTDINEETASTAERMVETMIRGAGIGLAGPQVGLKKCIFTVNLPGNEPMVFINLQILATSPELSTYEEGCLSIPGQYADVVRPASIQVQAWNLKGKPFTMEATGLMATVIQHELDHLNGILFIDYIDKKKRNKILKKFNVNPTENE